MKFEDCSKVSWLLSLAVILLGQCCLSTQVIADDDPYLTKVTNSVATSYLKAGNRELRRVESGSDFVVTYLKFKDGLEILGNRVWVYLDGQGNVRSIYDDSTENLQVGQQQPKLTAAQANQIAVNTLTNLNATGSDSRLVWFRQGDEGLLAWQIETRLARTNVPCSATQLMTTVDALTGDILSQWQRGGNEAEQGVVPYSPIVINDTFGTANAQAFGASFPAGCNPTNGGCSGALIAPNVVLGARHCGDSPGDLVRFGQDRNNPTFTATVQSVSLPDGAGSLLDGGDVSIITLNTNVPGGIAAPMRLIDETDELVGMTCQISGYGAQGVGSTGSGAPNGFRWACENTIDQYGTPALTSGSNCFSIDFDDGTAGNSTIGSETQITREGSAAPGDSGGPFMVNVNGENLIAAVVSGGTSSFVQYGVTSWYTGTAQFRTQIEAAGGVFANLDLNWNNSTGSPNPWFDVAANWNPNGTPEALNLVSFFQTGNNYQVWWDDITGDRNVREMIVGNDSVLFLNQPDNTTRYVIDVDGQFTSQSNATLTIRGIEVAAKIGLIDLSTTVVDGSAQAGSSLAVEDALFVQNSGLLRLQSGGEVAVMGTVTNSSEIQFQSSGTLSSGGGIFNNATSFLINLSGTGVVMADVTSPNGNLDDSIRCLDGTIRLEGSYNGGGTAVGGSTATAKIEIAGDYHPANASGQQTGTVSFKAVNSELLASSNTFIQLAGVSDFDQIRVVDSGLSPNFTAGGNLNVELINGFQLDANQSFHVINFLASGTFGGVFANVADGATVLSDNGFDLVARYESNGLFLDTVSQSMPPQNDDWNNTIFVGGGFPVTVTGTNVDATIQADEQELTLTGATVWWFVDTPEDGTFTIDTFGSDYDTQLHIYEFPGSGQFVDLIPLINNDDANGTAQSEVSFAAVAAQCYEIRVGGFDADGGGNGGAAAQGNITLNINFEPDAGGLPGDVNCDGEVNLLDVQPFINAISNGVYDPKADVNADGADNLLDVQPFINLLGG